MSTTLSTFLGVAFQNHCNHDEDQHDSDDPQDKVEEKYERPKQHVDVDQDVAPLCCTHRPGKNAWRGQPNANKVSDEQIHDCLDKVIHVRILYFLIDYT